MVSDVMAWQCTVSPLVQQRLWDADWAAICALALCAAGFDPRYIADTMQNFCAGNPTAAVPAPGAGSGAGATGAPARKLLQGRLNSSPSARRQYQALTVAVVAYVTRDSIFQAQVGPPFLCTCFFWHLRLPRQK